MAYNETLATRIRESLAELPNIEEKSMMGGLTFMYNGKMYVGNSKFDSNNYYLFFGCFNTLSTLSFFAFA